MISALFYLQAQTLRNSIGLRLKRLRRPKYFFGALAGLLYLWLIFGRTFFLAAGGHARGGSAPAFASPLLGLGEFLTSLGLLAVTLLMWVTPHGRAALVFTEAEIAFLFPAPVTRRMLVQYKLARGQLSIFFTVLFLTFLSSRSGGGWEGALIRGAGWWMLLSMVNLHLIGSSFAQTRLLEAGITPWRRRLLILGLAAAFFGAAAWWIARDTPPPQRADLANPQAIADYLQAVARSAPAQVLLAPFRWAVRPFMARDWHAFLAAFGPAAALLGLHYLWVSSADVAFEEASLEASRRHATRAAAMRSGRWQDARPHRKRRDPFPLAPTGAPAVAILWKNLLSAGQLFSARVWLPMMAWALCAGWAFNAGARHTAWPQILGGAAALLAGLSLLLGSQLVRQDFRQDLAAADLLKTYPMKGWQVALGELLAPALILTAIQWLLLLLTATLLGRSAAPLALGLSIVAPFLNFVTLLIPNAAALLFPAWFTVNPQDASGGTPGRGIEMLGQRLIFLLAQLAVFVMALAPAGLVAWLVYVLGAKPFLHPLAAMAVSGAVAAVILAGEAAFGLWGLGDVFDEYDLSAER